MGASRPEVPGGCVVSANACWIFKSIDEEAEQASLKVLAGRTNADALVELKKGDTSGCSDIPQAEAALYECKNSDR